MNLKLELEKFPIIDYKALDEYLILVSKNYDGKEYAENHHICPRSLFPEHARNKKNIVRLKYEDHVEAHRLLCLIYMNSKMKRAYSFMNKFGKDEKIKFLTSGAYCGDENPAKRPEVRKKISEAKRGKPRNDIVGKKFFGASEKAIQDGIVKMKEKLSDTVIVKDENNKRFRVSVNDERYISGELIPFNKGVTRENSASKRPHVMKKIMESREKSYEKFSKFTFEEMVDFLVEASNSGKNIFGKNKPFAKNYSGYCKRTKFDQNQLKESVVQRLSKG